MMSREIGFLVKELKPKQIYASTHFAFIQNQLVSRFSVTNSGNIHDGSLALGYRFEGVTYSYGEWVIDIGASYEPGVVYDTSYSLAIFADGFVESGMNFKTRYEVLPEIRGGLSF